MLVKACKADLGLELRVSWGLVNEKGTGGKPAPSERRMVCVIPLGLGQRPMLGRENPSILNLIIAYVNETLTSTQI